MFSMVSDEGELCCRYIGRFQGNMMERDRAYHNGTVWPYLLGAYCEAALRVANHEGTLTETCQVEFLLQHLIVW